MRRGCHIASSTIPPKEKAPQTSSQSFFFPPVERCLIFVTPLVWKKQAVVVSIILSRLLEGCKLKNKVQIESTVVLFSIKL